MDRDSKIGFILIAAVFVGFTIYQSKQETKAIEEARLQKAIQDSIDLAEGRVSPESYTNTAKTIELQDALQEPRKQAIYKDAGLQSAHYAAESFATLENDKIKVVFTTRGAKPYSVLVKDYTAYGSDSLSLIVPGSAQYDVKLYAGQYISTGEFTFEVSSIDASTLVMRLPMAQGGYIEQKYVLEEDSYLVRNYLSFNGMSGVINRNVSSYDIDYSLVVPRLEKGYKNELQYSKLNYYFPGEKDIEEIARGRSASKRIDSRFEWAAFHQQFFSAILRSPDGFSSGQVSMEFFPEDNNGRNLFNAKAEVRKDLVLDKEMPFELYFGPNHFKTLKSYDCKYEKTIPLGGWLVGWFTRYFIIPMFNWLGRYISSFGLIILIMTIIIKIVVLPLNYKSFSSSAKMQALKPLMDEINKKYPKPEDAAKKSQATMELYKRADASPASGCLPTLLTFPILWAMFRFFPASIELRQQGFLWADDLSAYDSIVDFGGKIPLIGDHLSLFALLMAIVMWAYSKMTTAQQPSASDDPSAASMKFMSVWFMPIMMFFICNNLSAGLSYYYLLSQLIAMIEMAVIKKTVDPAKVLAKVEASKGKPLPKSKFQQRLEEAQRMQEQQMKMQQKGRR